MGSSSFYTLDATSLLSDGLPSYFADDEKPVWYVDFTTSVYLFDLGPDTFSSFFHRPKDFFQTEEVIKTGANEEVTEL